MLDRDITSEDVARHRGLVYLVVNKLIRQGKLSPNVEYEDAIQVGMIAVWEALQRYDETRGKPSSYITAFIWGRVMNHQRNSTRANGYHRNPDIRVNVHSLELEDESYLDLVPADDDTEAEALRIIECEEMRTVVNRSLSILTAAQAHAVDAMVFRDRSLSQAAAEYGTTSQCMQMHGVRARRKLAVPLAQYAA